MPRPVKIRKKKSFMFTTKHHSFTGILGGVIAIVSITALCFCVYSSFMGKGVGNEKLGTIGLFAALSNVIGIICGVTSMNERDIHKWVPIAAGFINTVTLIIWIFLVILGVNA